MGKNRTTTHRGKCGNANHNTHNFMKGKEEVSGILCEGSSDEFDGSNLSVTELKFYERYADALAEQNNKYIQKRQYGRVKTLEDFYNSKRYRPSEEILQYGHVGGDVPTMDDFNNMTREYALWKMEWSESHGNHLHVLNYVNHFDEATPHSHLREIWDYTDENGVIRVGQEEAMKRAGLELPDPTKPEGRYNNRVITFSKMCRDKWNDICEQYGYEVERVPIPTKQKSKSIAEYKAEKERELLDRQEKLDTRELELDKREDELGNRERKLAFQYKQLNTLLVRAEELDKQAEQYVNLLEREYHTQHSKAKANITRNVEEVKTIRKNVMDNIEVRKIMNTWGNVEEEQDNEELELG